MKMLLSSSESFLYSSRISLTVISTKLLPPNGEGSCVVGVDELDDRMFIGGFVAVGVVMVVWGIGQGKAD